MNPPGQSWTARPAGHTAWFHWIMLLLALGGFGCRSIYHQSRAAYATEAEVRLKLRVAEAQQAERHADRAADRLREQVSKGLDAPALEPDLDRLERAALEFRRCVAAVADAAAKTEPPAGFSAERQRLELRSAQMLDAARLAREAGPAAALRQLGDLLRGEGAP